MMSVAAARMLADGGVLLRRHRPAEHRRQPRPPHARPGARAGLRVRRDRRQADRLPLSIGDGVLAETADAVVCVPEIFNYWLQPGRIDVGFLGAAQIDRFANINTTVIGARLRRTRRCACRAPAARRRSPRLRRGDLIVRQSARAFVEQLDFVTSVGHGRGPGRRERPAARPRADGVITDLGVLEPDPETASSSLTAPPPGRRRPSRRARRRAGSSSSRIRSR